MMVYARLYFRNEMERTEMTVRLFHLANHDALTGLANRNLLSDRLNQAISQAVRQKGQLIEKSRLLRAHGGTGHCIKKASAFGGDPAPAVRWMEGVFTATHSLL
jgi:hypothetical protein